jgi:peptidoglycan/LPS O-acetylase OafA/YrhL
VWLGASIGNLAVHAFFTVSGFLISGSLYRQSGLIYFAKARALRIFPGLLVCVLVVSLCLSPQSDATWSSYLEGATKYIFGTGTLLQFTDRLPGVFQTNPYPLAVNGSLWTLPLEAQCYLIAAVLSAAGALAGARREFALTCLIALVAVSVIWSDRFNGYGLWRTASLRPFLLSFLIGMLVATRKPGHLPIWYGAAGLGFLLCSNWAQTDGMKVALVAFAAGLFSLWFALAPLPQLTRISSKMPDLSYGIYIYAFPIQQSLYHFYPDINPFANFLGAALSVIPFAALSWYLVESQALRWKGYPVRPGRVVGPSAAG